MASNAVKELDEFNFHSVIADTAGISLVFFTGPHCASCHHLRDLLNAELEQFNKHFPDFTPFEIKADKAAALVNEFNVFHLPTLFLYQDSVFHCELQAEAHPTRIIAAIDLALKKPAEEEP